MDIQVVNVTFPEVFQRYSKKYNIFRDLYDHHLLALEIRGLNSALADEIYKIFLNMKEICYKISQEDSVSSNILVLGNMESFRIVAREVVSVGNEDLGYRINTMLRNYNIYNEMSFTLGNKEYSLNEAYVMGILNVTPDSFSDGGRFLKPDDAIDHALQMVDEGADFIDIGGESTRPGAEPVPVDQELERVIPVIDKLIKHNNNIIISIDTTKKEVARQALDKGAKIVNDISSFSNEPGILDIVKQYNSALVVMHMKGNPLNMQDNPSYEDVVSDVFDYLNSKLMAAKKAGIKNVLIDPGIGFGKRIGDNYELIRRLDEFKVLGAPILIGVSRKAFLGKSLGLKEEERDTATVVAESIAINNGARIVRTHNVKNAVQSRVIMKEILDII